MNIHIKLEWNNDRVSFYSKMVFTQIFMDTDALEWEDVMHITETLEKNGLSLTEEVYLQFKDAWENAQLTYKYRSGVIAVPDACSVLINGITPARIFMLAGS